MRSDRVEPDMEDLEKELSRYKDGIQSRPLLQNWSQRFNNQTKNRATDDIHTQQIASNAASTAAKTPSSSAAFPQTPQRPPSDVYTATQTPQTSGADHVGPLLEREARHRHDARWYSIGRDEARDQRILSTMSKTSVQEALKSVTDIEQCVSEEKLEHRLTRLLNVFAVASVTEVDTHQNGRQHNLAVSHGNFEVANPPRGQGRAQDLEKTKPDILIAREKPATRAYNWSDMLSVVEIKLSREDDLAHMVYHQVLRYARKLTQYNHVARHVHVVTWCGTLVRLWELDAASFCVSRAHDLRDETPATRLEIGKILWLLTAAEERSSLLSKWTAIIDTPVLLAESGRSAAKRRALGDSTRDSAIVASTENLEEWIWADDPTPVYIRESLFGSRTVVYRCHVRPKVGAADVLAASVATATVTTFVFVKCVWLLPHLAGYEGAMQKELEGIDGTPTPLGHMCVTADNAFARMTPLPDSHQHSGAQPPTVSQPRAPASSNQLKALFLDVLVFQHRQGMQIPDLNPKLSESDIVHVFAQVVAELWAYTQRNLHYRDFNVGNILVEVQSNGAAKSFRDGRPKLVLADHGNMRKGLLRRSGDGPVLLPGADDALRTLVPGLSEPDALQVEAPPFWQDAALDDVRSANPLFLPHCVHVLTAAHNQFRAKNKALVKRQTATEGGEVQTVASPVASLRKEMDLARKKIYVHAHRFIDDLESCTWLLLYLRVQNANVASLLDTMTALDSKSQVWTDREEWLEFLEAVFSPSDESWVQLFVDLREIICPAQQQLRKTLGDHYDAIVRASHLEYADLDLELPSQELERKCFCDVEQVLRKFSDSDTERG
ncbi:unnamed protein product [Jaminaea pallidilutea]